VNDTGARIKESSLGLEVPLHVQPRAKRNQIAGSYNGALKLKISAPPVEDAANKAIVEYFAQLLDLPKSRLHIVAGAKSRDKILRIDSISLGDFLSRIPRETV
jgi:uncharacterized protein